MLPEYFDPIRARITSALRRYLEEKRVELGRVNPMGAEAADKLIEFSLRGKMIRGCMVHLGWSLCGRGGPVGHEADAGVLAVTTAGAAMELFHSGLLVHDDIMDRDVVRRGQPSIFQQYAEAAGRELRSDPLHVGQALGICAGDVAYFMAFELLARAAAPAPVLRGVLESCARELSAVGIAQMQDVAWGASRSGGGVEEILRMYTHKTGRYSFSLPLLVGAAFAEAPKDVRSRLETFGECVGLLFQVRDDELGLFGDERQLGKPVGSDVREGKKTLLFSSLVTALDPAQRRVFDGIFGNPRATEADIEQVRTLAALPEVRARMEAITGPLIGKARSAMDAITSGSREDHAALRGLLDFTIARRQ
jgi:geranylgeranyl diphosphate synthase type I